MADPEYSDDVVVSLIIDKEGSLLVYSAKSKKWKPRWGVLSGGGLYTKKKQKDPELSQPIVIKGATLEPSEDKKKFIVKISLGGKEELIGFDSDTERSDWLTALKGNLDKDVGKGDKTLSKKSQSVSMRLKKGAVSSVATSSAGKGLIKEFLGKDGIKLIELVKQIITQYEGKKKATEVENNIIRVAVKVILLWRNKDITNENIATTVPKVKAVWSDIIDFCEMSFSYDPPKVKTSGDELVLCFTNLLKDFVTENTIERLRDTINYVTQQSLLDSVFASNDSEKEEIKKELMRILRAAWIVAFGSSKS